MKNRLATRLGVALIMGASLALLSGRSMPQAAPQFSEAPHSGDLLLSRSVYKGSALTVTVGDPLPPILPPPTNILSTQLTQAAAVSNGTYPGVFNNDKVDGSFGVTSPIYVDRYTANGASLQRRDTLNVPWNQVVTSFPSKSELALNPSTDGKHVTFMGYVAPVNTLDVSNSNTPGHFDPTNPVGTSYRRAVVQFDPANFDGGVTVTPVNAYSGNNGRAATLDAGNNQYLMVGNAGNGSCLEPDTIIKNTGVQLVAVGGGPETMVVGLPRTTGINASVKAPCVTANQPVQTVCQYGFTIFDLTPPPSKADKCGKDDNFRGMTIFNNTLYVTKGSGGNGVNTVYKVGADGTLPTATTAATTAITILPGFPTTLASSSTGVSFPFGIWFANASTLYVADEGDGKLGENPSLNPTAGLQKWVLQNGAWVKVYTLTNGLNLGVPYAVPGLDPSLNPTTDGLRNLTGRVNGDGTVTLFAITSTVSASGDQGADPNRLVSITDTIANTDPAHAGSESFSTLKTAAFGEVLRGVAWVPSNCDNHGSDDHDSDCGHFDRSDGNDR
jgi:hypothetical protein